jgi:DNA-binding transcriptional ArsR family regulator
MAISPLPETVQVYKALGHPARLRILAMLRGGELCACQITAVLELAPSTVSAHLAELRRAELVTERKAGRWVQFQLAQTETARETLEGLWRRVRRDAQVRSDKAVVKQLHTVPAEELCRADMNLSLLAIPRAG